MKVVHAAKFYPPVAGGMETVIADLARGTAAQWDVRVVAANTTATTANETVDGVRVVRAATYATANSVPIAPSYPFHLWREHADCLVLHEPNPIAGTACFLRTPAPRLVIWHHSDLVRPFWAPHTYGHLQRALYRRADCVVVSSPNLAADSPLVACARRVAVIPFGVALDEFRGDDAEGRRRSEQIRARTPGPRVLFVGRFVYYKGVDVLIDAMSRCPGTLTLVGEGPLEGALRAQADRLGLGGRVVFAGRVSNQDLRAHYRAADLFVLPSVARTEAFGVVQVEAMAAGLPVVSTDLPTGVSWVNRDGETGLVVRPGDSRALGDAIARLLGDEAARREMGRRAFDRATAVFSRDRMIRSFRELVETVVEQPEQLDARLAAAEVL